MLVHKPQLSTKSAPSGAAPPSIESPNRDEGRDKDVGATSTSYPAVCHPTQCGNQPAFRMSLAWFGVMVFAVAIGVAGTSGPLVTDIGKPLIGIFPAATFASTSTWNGPIYQATASSGAFAEAGRTNLKATRREP